MTTCACGSNAVNLDPHAERCDVCYLLDIISTIAMNASRSKTKIKWKNPGDPWEHAIEAMAKVRHKLQPLRPYPKEKP